ncbi:RidA family protein [Gemmatimonadota bacterium]
MAHATRRLRVLLAVFLFAGCGSPDRGSRETSAAQTDNPAGQAEAAPAATTQDTPEKTVIRPAGYRPTPSPLSPGILVGNTLYLSGSTGGDPTTGQLVPGGFEAEMRQVMTNMETVLATAEMDLSNVVQVTTYLLDMADYGRYNEIYREYFTQEPLPTRATVAVRELARGALIEMMMVAVR